MKLTDELFARGVNQEDIFSVIDDDYVLLKKSMPCKDHELAEYISSIERAHNDGINTPRITDYRFIEGKTSTFGPENDRYSYTTGVFIEERAKGKCIGSKGYVNYRNKDDYYFYLNEIKEYIEELTNRACAPQEVYDKFVDDYIKLSEYGLNPDPKPLNFFFSKDTGFTIIDVIDVRDESLVYVPRYIFMGVVGYGIPRLLDADWQNISFIPQSLYDIYVDAQNKVVDKVLRALKSKNIDEEYIKNGLYSTKVNSDFKGEVIPDDLLEEYINSKQR